MAPNLPLLFFSLSLLYLGRVAALLPAELIYQFPNETWVENLAVRSNGELLVTLVSSPEIYSIQPSPADPRPKLVHRFDNFTTVTGIIEIRPDVFLAAVTSISKQPIPGAGALYEVNLSHGDQPRVSQSLPLSDVALPNGLVKLNPNKVLIADSTKGNIVVADLKARKASIAVTDPLLLPSSNATGLPGVNGLKIQGRTLYFTSTGQNIFGQIPIDLDTGFARGPATKIGSSLTPGSGYDDFALGKNGDAYLANGFGNVIERFNIFAKAQEVVSGRSDSLTIAEPTSVRFGRKGMEDTLFVTTSGGISSPPRLGIVGGQVLAIKLDQ